MAEEIDHDEELAPPDVLEAIQPRPLTRDEIELILEPAPASQKGWKLWRR